MPKSIPHGARLHGVNEAARILGLTPQGFLKAGPPEADVWLNDSRGWMMETLREWQSTRPRVRRPVTDEKRARIIEMYKEGRSIADTIAECEVSQSTVIRIRADSKK